MIEFQIREYKSGDDVACQKLNKIVDDWLNDTDNVLANDLSDIESHYLSCGGNFWVAQIDAQIVGIIGIKHLGDKAGYIKRFKVHPDHQKKGIGTKLLMTLIAWAQNNYFINIMCTSGKAEKVAHKLYRKFGFKELGEVRGQRNLNFNLDL